MFLYEKKIEYLTFFKEGVRKSTAGFVRISRQRDACKLDIHIKKSTGISDGSYALFLVLKDREMPWGTVAVRNGEAAVEKEIPVRKDMFLAGEESFQKDDFCGLLVQISAKQWISCYWKETAAARVREPEKEPEITSAERARGEETAGGLQEEEPGAKSACARRCRGEESEAKSACVRQCRKREAEMRPAERLQEGNYIETNSEGKIYSSPLELKWKQLQKCYKKVHPFGDERMFLSVELKDFQLLKAPYQKLANNSFLLHGFYNYGHLILGPDKELGGRTGLCFYLGVPGTYFEREKMVAVMFGFEGFECSGAVEIGKFGYYMRRVEIG
ncbi:MAG: hypothetical protein NC400_09170 [Clostridium sp.]|nr:hypothetical protein [Clostridium sp.]